MIITDGGFDFHFNILLLFSIYICFICKSLKGNFRQKATKEMKLNLNEKAASHFVTFLLLHFCFKFGFDTQPKASCSAANLVKDYYLKKDSLHVVFVQHSRFPLLGLQRLVFFTNYKADSILSQNVPNSISCHVCDGRMLNMLKKIFKKQQQKLFSSLCLFVSRNHWPSKT